MFLSVIKCLLLDVDKEDAVAARAVLIHVCGRERETFLVPTPED